MSDKRGGPALGAITASAGVAGAPEHGSTATDGSTATELLHAADNAMYAAKQSGGSRVVVYQTKES